MKSSCKACNEALDDDASYCRCGGHFHRECQKRHEDWCPRAGRDRWLGAVEL